MRLMIFDNLWYFRIVNFFFCAVATFQKIISLNLYLGILSYQNHTSLWWLIKQKIVLCGKKVVNFVVPYVVPFAV